MTSHPTTFRPLTVTELDTVRSYASANGRTWKDQLLSEWYSASAEPGAVLTALAHSHGPSWLATFRLPKTVPALLFLYAQAAQAAGQVSL